MTVATDTWAEVVGQPDVVAQLQSSASNPVHAYMFLGPHGSGRWAAARAFAADVLAQGLDGEAAERAVRLALRGEHPDLVKIEPSGNQFRSDLKNPADAEQLILEASRSPIEGTRKVIVADRFHTANATAIGRILKTLEEPPESTIIVLLSEDVPEEQITIASRCVVLPFHAVPHADVVAWLGARNIAPELADTVALASGGDLHRAADLSGDDQVVRRYEAWRTALDRLDGTGAAVAMLVEELRGLIDDAQGPIDERHAAELDALAEREDQLGTRGAGRRDFEAAQKREVRRLRMDELRFGLATLARVYRDRLVETPSPSQVAAISAIRNANEALIRNPNEALLLQALFLELGAS